MLNRKLLEVLLRLAEADRKNLRLFLSSPYFNYGANAANIIRLYDLIILHEVNEQHPLLSKEAVSELIFPGHIFKEKKKGPVDALTSELFRLVRQFIAHKELEQDFGDTYSHLALARFYRRHALEDRFWQTMQSARKIQNEFPWRDGRFYYLQFKIEEEENIFRGMYNSFDDQMNLKAALLNLDLFYSVLRLELTSNLEYQKYHTQIDDTTIDELGNHVFNLSAEGQRLAIPLNQMYHLVINILKNLEDKNSIVHLEQLMDRYKSQIPPDKFNEFKAYCRFYWINHYQKSGDQNSRHHVFEVYKKDMENGHLYLDGSIPYSTFRNLVIFALKLGETDWVKTFLETHPPARICGTRYPTEVHSLNTAEYYFYLKQHEKALATLVYRLFENPSYSILADVLLIKIYFETDSELLAPRMKALDQKIRRSNQSKEVKERYLNFLRKLDKIVKYGWQKRSSKREKLIEEIKSTQAISQREWLLEILEKK